MIINLINDHVFYFKKPSDDEFLIGRVYDRLIAFTTFREDFNRENREFEVVGGVLVIVALKLVSFVFSESS